MIANKELLSLISEASKTGDATLLNEIVANSQERHKTYDVAIQTPEEWATWAMINPRDSIRILDSWVSQGRDVSMFTKNYWPDLTPCDSFANALGFAIHLNLDRFKFRNYGNYSSPIHVYSTRPVRGASSQPQTTDNTNVTARRFNYTEEEPVADTKATPESEKVYNTYKERMLAAINANNRTELATVYNEIIAKPELTNKQKMELKRVYANSKSAIRNQQRADRQTSKGFNNMAGDSANRATKKINKVAGNETLSDLNELKSFIKQTMLKEAKKI